MLLKQRSIIKIHLTLKRNSGEIFKILVCNKNSKINSLGITRTMYYSEIARTTVSQNQMNCDKQVDSYSFRLNVKPGRKIFSKTSLCFNCLPLVPEFAKFCPAVISFWYSPLFFIKHSCVPCSNTPPPLTYKMWSNVGKYCNNLS